MRELLARENIGTVVLEFAEDFLVKFFGSMTHAVLPKTEPPTSFTVLSLESLCLCYAEPTSRQFSRFAISMPNLSMLVVLLGTINGSHVFAWNANALLK